MNPRPKSGRRKTYTREDEQKVLTLINKYPKLRYNKIRILSKLNVCTRTINKIALDNGLRTRRCIKRPFLTPGKI